MNLLYWILGLIYFLMMIPCIGYLKHFYFPNNITSFEKFILSVLTLAWIISVPVTFILYQDYEGEEI